MWFTGPGVVRLIAVYCVRQKLGLIDTLLSVILVKVALELSMLLLPKAGKFLLM